MILDCWKRSWDVTLVDCEDNREYEIWENGIIAIIVRCEEIIQSRSMKAK